jgi:hypothetical protein
VPTPIGARQPSRIKESGEQKFRETLCFGLTVSGGYRSALEPPEIC